MSAQQTYAFCIDCWELTYGIPDRNGVYTRASGAPNHHGHAQHVFGAPDEYAPPIRLVLSHLQSNLPVTDNQIVLFSLALATSAIQPTNGVPVTMPPHPDGYAPETCVGPRSLFDYAEVES